MFLRPSTLLLLGSLILCGCERRPISTQACTAPRDYWQEPHSIGGLERPFLQVTLDHGNTIYVDGRPANKAELVKALTTAATLNPEADVFLDTEMGADCRVLELLRDQIDRSMNCRQSHRCAEGSRTVWKEWNIPDGTPPS